MTGGYCRTMTTENSRYPFARQREPKRVLSRTRYNLGMETQNLQRTPLAMGAWPSVFFRNKSTTVKVAIVRRDTSTMLESAVG